MSKTKQKIIQSAVVLFNQNGVVNTRIQDIAAEAGISPGNLTYHYKTKRALMQSVFRYMIKTMEQMALGNQLFVEGAEGMSVAKNFLEFQVKFRFFYLDTLEIIRAFPEIKVSYQEQVEREINFIKNLLYFAAGKGYLIPEPIEGHYDALAQNAWTILNFRLTKREIIGKEGFGIEEGLKELTALYYPYFTEKGAAYFDTLKSMEAMDF